MKAEDKIKELQRDLLKLKEEVLHLKETHWEKQESLPKLVVDAIVQTDNSAQVDFQIDGLSSISDWL